MPADDLFPEIKAEITRIGRDFKSVQAESQRYTDAMVAAATSRLASDIDLISVRLAQGDRWNGVRGGEKKVQTAEDRAFSTYLRRGRDVLEAHEIKALTVSSDPAAGYLAPPAFLTELQRALRDASPLRRLGRIVTTNSGGIVTPRQTAGTSAYWAVRLSGTVY